MTTPAALSFRALEREFIFVRAEDRVRFGAVTGRRQLNDAAVSNPEHGGYRLHVY
jgi:hypothetical protein